MKRLAIDPRFAISGDRAARSESGAGRLAWWLLAVGLVCELVLSAQGLLALGIPYDAPWGNYAAKLHPGTYLSFAAAAVALVDHGNPLAIGTQSLRREPLLASYLAAIFFVFAYSLLHNGPSGAAFIIDTLVVPAITVLTLNLLPGRRRRQCLLVLLLPLTLNALMGLVEALLRQRAIPMIIGGVYEAIDTSFRPSALMGHPLVNALATATLLPLPLYLRLPTGWRMAWMALLWVALLGFGGRTSFVVATLIFGLWMLGGTVRDALKGRYGYVQIVAGLLAMLLVPTVIAAVVASSGLGDRIVQGLTWDASAEVRARIWELPGFLDDRDVLFGVSPQGIEELSARIGLKSANEAIENFWLSMFLQLGLVGFVPFVFAMGCAMRWIWSVSKTPMRLSMVVFFLSASTTNSLASKTVCLTLLFAAVAATRERLSPPQRPRIFPSATVGRPALQRVKS